MAEQILSHIEKPLQSKIVELFKKTEENKEFEFIFFSNKGQRMNKEKYISMIKYMKNISKKNKYNLEIEKTLDIGYNSTTDETFRLLIDGEKNINRELNIFNDLQNVNSAIFKYMINKSDNNFILKKKIDTLDITDLNFKIRLAEEIKINKKNLDKYLDANLKNLLSGQALDTETKYLLNENIFFRLKERLSMYIVKEKDFYIRVDLTDTKTTKNYKTIKTSSPSTGYELEIEFSSIKNPDKSQEKYLKKMYEETENILKYLQNSPFIIGLNKTKEIINFYKDMNNITQEITKLVARQAVSVEIQHVTDNISNRYAITDKADGDRYFLIIYNNCVYLISNNLIVKDTGIVLDKKLSKYNGSLMDGEFIYVPKSRRYIFLIFDCMRIGDEDIRNEQSLLIRLKNADDIINDCFLLGEQKGFAFKEPPKLNLDDGKFDINEISKFWGNELVKYQKALNNDIEIMPIYPVIRRKFFIPIYGIHKWEIFKYAVEYWNKYTEDKNINYSYVLDGLIFHPLIQSYVIGNESKYPEYKWKPANKNSIDFYIEFKRDKLTNEILDVYDNSLAVSNDNINYDDDTEKIKNKTYRICNLYVGKFSNGMEQPVPFTQNYNITYARLYLKNGEVRDIEDKIISDKTVVEFYYNNDMNILPEERWVPLKTRYDKTEAVEKYRRQYGNNNIIADKIWRSIINPVLMSDFVELAKGNTITTNFYDNKIKELNAKVSHGLVIAANKENKYYQKKNLLAKKMGEFHSGFMKSILLYTHLNKIYQENKQLSVLELAVGRGGDMYKWYYANVAYVVGVDLHDDGFKSPVDGAFSRYNRLDETKPNCPKMYFIQADVRASLDYETQLKVIGSMDESNKQLLQQFFPSNVDDNKVQKYDRISCQFAMHYFLKDELSWSNFKQNIKKYLRDGGYYIATTFDGKEVVKALKDKKSITIYYDDSDGNKKKLFDIIKKYEDPPEKTIIGTGYCIDVHGAWMFEEGQYVPEYIVDMDFVKEEFEKDIDLELIDEDLFFNQMAIHKEFIINTSKFESSPETRQFLQKSAHYYEETEMNKKFHIYTNLTRYMIFRRKKHNTVKITETKKQKGGFEKYDFSNKKLYKIPDMNSYNNEYSFVGSIHKLLESHSIIPKSVSYQELTNSFGVDCLNDNEIKKEYILSLGKKAIIDHELEDDKQKNVLNGLNISIIEKDCNDFYDITNYGNKYNKTILLVKDKNLYRPLLQNFKDKSKGVFKKSDDIVEYLFNNGDLIE